MEMILLTKKMQNINEVMNKTTGYFFPYLKNELKEFEIFEHIINYSQLFQCEKEVRYAFKNSLPPEIFTELY